MASPYVSVVICTTKHPKEVLEDLSFQTFKDFEVIIASEKGIVQAMNEALKKAKGDIFVRTDDDVSLPAHWLEELIKPFKDETVAGVTGPTYVPPHLRQNRDSIKIWEKPPFYLKWLQDGIKFMPAKIYQCGMVSYDSNYAGRFPRHLEWFEPDHLEGCNWAMRTDLIINEGGFDPKFNGVCEWFDTDVEQKIIKQGYKLIYNPKAYVWHFLEKGPQYAERFDGWGRIKNWLLYHRRHSKFHWKKVAYLIIWGGYFAWKALRSLFQR